jgi:hypothetical protein
MRRIKMATTTTKTRTSGRSTTTTTTAPSVVIPPATQRFIGKLRTSRDTEKQAKAEASLAREALLTFFGEVTQNIIGTDAKGKRLVSVKVIPSSERIDWTELEKQDPELYQTIRGLLAKFIVPKGEGEPTIRVDVI